MPAQIVGKRFVAVKCEAQVARHLTPVNDNRHTLHKEELRNSYIMQMIHSHTPVEIVNILVFAFPIGKI